MKSPIPLTCFLFDNGSLRAASTLNLRLIGRALEREIGGGVQTVSLLHSSAVDAAELGGERAQLLEPALQAWLGANPEGHVVLLPLFFGPSGALTEYLPERLGSLAAKFPRARLKLARPLVNCGEPDVRVAEALAHAVRAVISERALRRPNVVVVDHGSPQRAVTAVRDHLGMQVRAILEGAVEAVGVASMEKREGEDYSFNDPLLSACLRKPPFNSGDVVLALQFLSPGRHAGAGGDIAGICDAARAQQPALRTWMTHPIGTDERIVQVLAERYREAAAMLG